MLTASVETLLSVVGGSLLGGSMDAVASGVVIDSRAVEPGSVFVALRGENVDGHDFLDDALRRGARVLMVSRPAEQIAPAVEAAARSEAAVIRVDEPLAAIHDMAAWHRRRLHATVIGVTGSTGKTTTKDFMTSVLSGPFRVVATQGNRNNELGLPLTILDAGDVDVLVLEMGMRGLGQIAHLAEIGRPDFGLVTNVGTSHIELLGTQDAVATAKGELVRAIEPGGRVFLNGDDAYSDALAVDSRAPVTLYGLSERCEVRAVGIELDETSRPSFTLVSPQGEYPIALSLPGRHNVYNALAAAAVALALGLSPEQIAEGLAAASVTSMRMQTIETARGTVVINDAYNANPSSMRAAIEVLAGMRVSGRRVAVLGDMAELGSLSELAHFQIGEVVARSGIEVLITVGPRARRIADGARAEGMPAGHIHAIECSSEARRWLAEGVESDDVVLVKASRVMGLEDVVEGIVSSSAG